MRVKQTAIIKKAVQENCSEAQINALSRDDVPVALIERMFIYCVKQNEYDVDKELSAKEADRVISFLHNKRQRGKINPQELNEMLYYMLPSEQDSLIGNDNKFRLYHAVKLRYKHDPTDATGESFSPFDSYPTVAMRMYYKMLCGGVDFKIANKMMKYFIRRKYLSSAETLIMYNDEIIDDICHNKWESFIAILIDNNHIGDVRITNANIKNLYDPIAHKFCFNRSNINEYFIEDASPFSVYEFDEIKFAEKQKAEHPLVSHIAKFCKRNNMSTHNYLHSDLFSFWEAKGLSDSTRLDRYFEAFKILQQPYDVDAMSWSVDVNVRTSFFVNIHYHEHSGINVYGDYGQCWYPRAEKIRYSVDLMITPDGKFFRRFNNQNKVKTIPLTVSELLSFLRKDNVFGKLMKHIVAYYGKKNKFINDVLSDCEEVDCCVLPISFNEIMDYHNKTHFITSKYKTANGLNTNWNKKNINLSYMILKCYPLVEPGVSQNTLLQIKDASLVNESMYRAKLDRKIVMFLTNYLYEAVLDAEKRRNSRAVKSLVKECDHELKTEIATAILDDEYHAWLNDKVEGELSCTQLHRDISDYVHMCRTSKKKIRLDVKSRSQMNNLHDIAAHGERDNTYYRRNTKVVSIPKNSRFLHLREILPKDFEWITSRKRLILETELQHHCVWSYADKITEDRCAIYSFVDVNAQHTHDGKPKRYTIEFDVDHNGRYSIVQVQGKYDRVHTDDMSCYIQSILDKGQKVS